MTRRTRTRAALDIEAMWLRGDPPPETPATQEQYDDFGALEFFADTNYRHIHGVPHPFQQQWWAWESEFERRRAKEKSASTASVPR